MSQRIKLLFLPISILAILTLSGCGQKSADNSGAEKPVSVNKEKASSDQANLPQPTGKVDDALNAIDQEAQGEKDMVSSEDNEAQNAVAPDQETNDFGESYDDKEL